MTAPAQLCGSQYPRGKASPGARIVDCQLERGHDGPHAEYWDESRTHRSEWPNTGPYERERLGVWPDPTPAETMRAAAARLRELAQAATPSSSRLAMADLLDATAEVVENPITLLMARQDGKTSFMLAVQRQEAKALDLARLVLEDRRG